MPGPFSSQEQPMPSAAFPPDVESFVERELAAGSFSSRDELILAAVKSLRDRKLAHEQLRAEIDKGMEGEGVPAEEVFAMLRERYGKDTQDAGA
jgi:putative addiction module CopG family antidote